MTTATDIARRNGGTPAPQQAALAIRPGQLMWDEYQAAALEQIGLKDASNADRAVFLHQCQRTGLDPFARQIYMIGRQEKQRDGSWRTKWTIQTGIDGYRVMRDRVKKRDVVRVTVSRPLWYDHEGSPYQVWFREEPPTACEVTVTVDDDPYTSVLLFREYCQYKDGRAVAQWATKPAHMLEKCTEADAYRKAFPQDFSGVHLDDAMPPADDDAPQRQRVTAEQARQRRTVAATVVTPDASPAAVPTAAESSEVPPTEPAAPPAAGEIPARASSGQRTRIRKNFERLGYNLDDPDDEQATLKRAAKLAGLDDIGTLDLDELDQDQAVTVIKHLDGCKTLADLEALLNDGVAPGETGA